jgi:hypothetical protein
MENSQEMASKAPLDSIGLSSLQLLPSSNVPLPCLICARQFWHIRDLAIHLVNYLIYVRIAFFYFRENTLIGP